MHAGRGAPNPGRSMCQRPPELARPASQSASPGLADGLPGLLATSCHPLYIRILPGMRRPSRWRGLLRLPVRNHPDFRAAPTAPCWTWDGQSVTRRRALSQARGPGDFFVAGRPLTLPYRPISRLGVSGLRGANGASGGRSTVPGQLRGTSGTPRTGRLFRPDGQFR